MPEKLSQKRRVPRQRRVRREVRVRFVKAGTTARRGEGAERRLKERLLAHLVDMSESGLRLRELYSALRDLHRAFAEASAFLHPIRKNYRRAETLRRARASYFSDRSLLNLDESDRIAPAAFRIRLRRLRVQVCALQLRMERLQALFLGSTLAILVIGTAAAFTLKLNSHLGFGAFWLAFVATIAIQVGLLALIERIFSSLLSSLVAIAIPAGFIALAWQLSQGLPASSIERLMFSDVETFHDGFVSGILLAGVVILPLIGSVVLWELFAILQQRYDTRRYSDALALDALMSVLNDLHLPEHRFADSAVRRRAAYHLEFATRVIELDLRRAARISDVAIDEAAVVRIRQITRWMHMQQLSLTLPDVDNLFELRRMVRAAVSAVCTGRFGALPLKVIELNDTGGGGHWARTSLAYLRSLLVALIPLGSVIALDRAGILAKDVAGRTIVTAAAVWAIIGVLSAFDPLLPTRVQATKDIMSIFKPDAKK